MDDEIRRYYDRGREAERLARGPGLLERARTEELLERFLPAGPLDIVDVGGGPGVYATTLAARGHTVELIDPVDLHVTQAVEADPRVSARVGDARDLPVPDGSADAVLLLGPLYHLVEQADRLAALGEAHRVLRPGGVLFAAGISRHSGLLDLLIRVDALHESGVLDVVREAIATGRFLGAERGLFTTAYFHRPTELADEVAAAGFDDVRVLGIEGPGGLARDIDERWEDPPRREALLEAARLVEEDPAMLPAAGHLMAIARTGDDGVRTGPS